jgi:hypothetical protein
VVDALPPNLDELVYREFVGCDGLAEGGSVEGEGVLAFLLDLLLGEFFRKRVAVHCKPHQTSVVALLFEIADETCMLGFLLVLVIDELFGEEEVLPVFDGVEGILVEEVADFELRHEYFQSPAL